MTGVSQQEEQNVRVWLPAAAPTACSCGVYFSSEGVGAGRSPRGRRIHLLNVESLDLDQATLALPTLTGVLSQAVVNICFH